MAEKLERFGKFLLLDHLVDGGMAKICRARQLGEVADKMVAIKMVQPQYSSDPGFQKMFYDEIKLATKLIHPNVVQTYEHGMHNKQLYVAMEYCDGKNLKEYLDKLKEKKFVFPIDVSVYIITQACQGLHYAHTLTDKLTGQPYNIVHRDISPHNIMLTYDGGVKIIDFGIAKAETNSEATQAGTIKGKLSYLAPEYLEGMALDKRYDEFAIGITIWEMLCGRKLFKAQNDLAVLKKIQECKIPAPSSINPNVPKELDEIVLKALHKDRTKRYDDLDQLNRALIKFLYAHNPDFNASDLVYFAKELFKEEIKKDREKLFAFGKMDISPYMDDLKREMEGGTKAGTVGGGGTTPSFGRTVGETTAKKEVVLDFGFEDKASTKKINKAAKAREGIESNMSEGVDSALKMDLKRKGGKKTSNSTSPSMQKKTSSATSTKQISKSQMTASRTAILNTKKDNKGKIIGGAIAAVLALVVLRFPDQILEMIKGGSSIDSRNPASSVNAPVVPNKVNGKILTSNFIKLKQKVFINGQEVTPTAIGDIDYPVGKGVLRVQTQGHEHFVTRFEITKDSPTFKIEVPKTSPAEYGYLFTTRDCVVGNLIFNLYGEDRTEKLPSPKGVAFPIHTDHEVFYQVQGESLQRKLRFRIEREDDTVDLCQKIEEQN